MRTTFCKACGGLIVIVTPNGAVLSCELQGEPRAATGLGYIPHWATCPAAHTIKSEQQKTAAEDMQQISLFE